MLSFSLWGNGKSREFQSTTFKLQLALAKVSVGLMSTGRGRGVMVEQTTGELVHVLVATRGRSPKFVEILDGESPVKGSEETSMTELKNLWSPCVLYLARQKLEMNKTEELFEICLFTFFSQLALFFHVVLTVVK